MRKILVFENALYNAALEKELYYFCLKRQFSLLKYAITYFFYSFLYFFKVISKKKYAQKRWSFLADVKDIEATLNHFWKSRKKKFAHIVSENKTEWISEYPDILLKDLAKQCQVELTANQYDIAAKKILRFEDVYQLYEKTVPGEKPQIYDEYHSKLKKVKDADFFIVNNRKIFASSGKYWAHKILSATYTGFMLLMMGLSLGLISMYFGTAYYKMPMFLSYFNVSYLPFLNIFPVVFLLFLLYFIFNRVWVSFLFTAFVTIGLSLINYWKLLIRNDPLLAIDASLFFESIGMAGEFEIQLDWKIIAVIIACVLGTAVAIFLVKAKITSSRLRLTGIAVLVSVGVYSFTTIYMDSSIYSSKQNFDLINRWSSTQVYISKGFIYPFIYSIKSSLDKPPEGYNAEATKERLSAYEYSDIADNKKVNVVSIMLEAYNDFSKFEAIEFDKDPYEYWHQLEAESYSGELATNIFAGATVNTEWGFLTGFTTHTSFRSNVNSYPHYFREQGYTVEGSHPSYDWFYNRKNVNKYLGFENYYYLENHYAELANGGIAKDSILFPEIIKLYEANKKIEKPYFSFNVTYQNHGPYSTKKLTEKQYAKNKGYPEEEYNILNNYLSGIHNTTQELKTFIDFFREEEEPVIVILFGDHNPWLGDNNSVYNMLGINFDLGTEEGFYNYYNTPYLIWANDAAKEILGNTMIGDGPTIGPYFLMNEFFDLAGYDGNEFMKVSNELKAVVDVVHRNDRYKESGTLTSELSSQSEQKLADFLQIQYHWRKNFK